MPDGKRKRRHSENLMKRAWYAHHRSCRFRQRFGWELANELDAENRGATGYDTAQQFLLSLSRSASP